MLTVIDVVIASVGELKPQPPESNEKYLVFPEVLFKMRIVWTCSTIQYFLLF